MRYTTIIDITELPSIYRNANTRLLYIHLSLIAGYHDTDRDLALVSIRRLAMDTGLSVSAVRHALRILEQAGLITRQGPAWLVKKWLPQETITPRAKTEAEAKTRATMEAERSAQRAREEQREADKRQQQQYAAEGKSSFMVYYEDLQKKAAEGDLEAAELVKRHARTYQQHVAARAATENISQKKS